LADIPPVPVPGSDQPPTSLQIPGFFDALRAVSALPFRVTFSLDPEQFAALQEMNMSLRTDLDAKIQEIKDAIAAEAAQRNADLARSIADAVAPLNAQIAQLQASLNAGDQITQADIDALKAIEDSIKAIVPDQPVPIPVPPIVPDGGDTNNPTPAPAPDPAPPVPPVPPAPSA